LEQVGLADRWHHLPSELSGGQNQRVAIARAMANKPKLILADEPTGALDSKTSEEIVSLFKKLNQEGITIVVVTHDMHVAEQANRIIRINDGIIDHAGY
ncbi:MAG: ATP-binding cassette domain-containing protein, partial [Bacteroidetes bacterium]|nr:ATP-binding cassette domain-containing protein [Bacteroidota bacterium]